MDDALAHSKYIMDVEGGVVVDKRPCCDKEEFVNWVCSDPFLDERLPPKTATTRPKVLSRPSGSATYYREFLHCKDISRLNTFKPFEISLDLHLDLWRERGARIGKRVKNTIVWEDGETFKIPPFGKRFQGQEA